MSAWNLENTVFSSYCFYAGVLAAKVLLMGPATGYYRITKKVFANEEDAKSMGAKGVQMNDPDVERVRRAHQNDIENIPVFWMSGLLYVLTNPAASTAITVFRVYTAARVLHSVLYLRGSWLRPLAYFVGIGTNMYMLASTLRTFYNMHAHQNDLENIPVFWILGLLYVLTNPSEMIAKNVFRAFCGARVMHTVFYLGGSSRRGIAYMLGMACNVFLAVNVIMNFCC